MKLQHFLWSKWYPSPCRNRNRELSWLPWGIGRSSTIPQAVRFPTLSLSNKMTLTLTSSAPLLFLKVRNKWRKAFSFSLRKKSNNQKCLKITANTVSSPLCEIMENVFIQSPHCKAVFRGSDRSSKRGLLTSNSLLLPFHHAYLCSQAETG